MIMDEIILLFLLLLKLNIIHASNTIFNRLMKGYYI
jgi:hypothetical protein